MRVTILIVFLMIALGTNAATDKDVDSNADRAKITLEYAKAVFRARRSEQHQQVRTMLKYEYEKQFKLLDLAYEKIFEVLVSSNNSLNKVGYQVRDGFPTVLNEQEALAKVLENCCMAAECILHFPEISYRIFHKEKMDSWKSNLNWCIGFLNGMGDFVDEKTFKLLDLLQQEINEELRTEDFINPYVQQLKQTDSDATTKKQKQRKKLKKGPHLSGHNEL